MFVHRFRLLSGLALSVSAMSMVASAGGFLVKGGTFQRAADKSTFCATRCIIHLIETSVSDFEAARITTDPLTGIVRLKGEVRVTFTDGTELRADQVTIATFSNEKQQLDGEAFRLVPIKN
jgi:hypothetical protein